MNGDGDEGDAGWESSMMYEIVRHTDAGMTTRVVLKKTHGKRAEGKREKWK